MKKSEAESLIGIYSGCVRRSGHELVFHLVRNASKSESGRNLHSLARLPIYRILEYYPFTEIIRAKFYRMSYAKHN